MKLYRLVPLWIVIFSGCAVGPTIDDSWSDQIPPKDYFLDYYDTYSSKPETFTRNDYLLWIKRFYLGWELYARGWLKATDELVETLDNPTDIELAKQKGYAIGKLISAEWALENRVRKINNAHLSIWGNSMLESIVQKEQLVMLDKILADAKGLMDYTLSAKDITYERYYPLDQFGGTFE